MRIREFVALAVGLFALAGGLAAQGIRVVGSADVPVASSALVLKARVAAKAELAGDALKKFSDRRRRAMEALEKLEVEGLQLTAEGATVVIGGGGTDPNGFVIAGRGVPDPEPEVRVAEMLVLRLGGYADRDEDDRRETLVTLLETLKEAELELAEPTNPRVFNPNQGKFDPARPGIYFAPSDARASEDAAYAAAFADARGRAERLAALAGVKIGKVSGIETMKDEPVTLASSPEARHAVTLRVTFEIAP
ncbi:MAG: SIMPL domain-containing protein [Planctomycetota bacterium]